MTDCAGKQLENGIHHLIFYKASRQAVDEFAAYGMMVLDKRASDEEKVMFLIDISRSGLPPVRYSVESLRTVWKDRSSKNVRVAYLHSKSLIIALFVPVLEALRLQTQRKLFPDDAQDQAITWLLERN